MPRISRIALAFPLLVLGGGLVLAQDPPPAEPEPPAVIDVPVRERAPISVADMQAQSVKIEAAMNDVQRRMVELQELARKEKDVIRLNCVNDKLAQLKQLLAIADQARSNLEEAISRNDEEGRYHEFGRLTIAQQQAEVLGSDAENCVGEDLTFLGPTQVSVDEPALPEELPGPDFPVVEPLPIASPQA